MIVRQTETSLLLITQPDHALLARRLMEPWAAIAQSDRRASVLHAIGEHDNGWREPDASPLIDPDSGRILDFVSAPAGVRQAVWPRAVARLSDDPWAAALVAQHAMTVYDRFRPVAEWSAFFSEMAGARDRHLHASGLTQEELRRDYVFLRVGDLASLTFCSEWTEEQRFEQYAARLDGPRLVIAPDPYGGRAVSFEVTARELPRRTFSSDADARAAFLAARVVTLSGQAVGGRSS